MGEGNTCPRLVARRGGDGVITCFSCVKDDPVFQECLDDLARALDNIGYNSWNSYCPCCGKRLEVKE